MNASFLYLNGNLRDVHLDEVEAIVSGTSLSRHFLFYQKLFHSAIANSQVYLKIEKF